MYTHQQLNLENFIALETVLEETARRTKRLNLQRETLIGIQNAIDESDIGILTQNNLLKYAPNIIEHSTMADKVIIPYGWDEKRLIFILSYSEPIPGGEKFTFIQGYTDYYDRSYTGQIDPNTKFYFNTIIEVQFITNRLGNRSVYVSKAFKTVYNPLSNSYEFEHDDRLVSDYNASSDLLVLRPRDIAMNITNRVNDLGDNFIADNRYNEDLKSVDVKDELGTHLVTNVINKYRDTVDDVSAFTDMNTQLNAISSLSGISPYTISLLGILKSKRSLENYGSLDITYATLDELLDIFPELMSDKSHIIEAVDPRSSLMGMRQHLAANEIDVNTQETKIHAITSELATGIATLMLNHTITKLSMVLTNYYVEGLEQFDQDYYFLVFDAASIIPGLAPENIIKNLVQDIMINLMPSVSSNNTIDIHIVVTMDLFGISYLEVSFDGMEPRIIPFSDAVSSLYTPSIIDAPAADTELEKFETIVREVI